jgi:hypothetical protein
MSIPLQSSKIANIRSRVVHWTAELLLVFIGVYGAFWLSSYQERHREAQRHDRILATLEDSVQKSVKRYEAAAEQQDQVTADFRRRLEAGEMPPLGMFFFSSGYSASDAATLLQSGGLDLLDPTTISALRNAESVSRTGNSEMQQIQTLSNELIAPNLDQDISFFYDPLQSTCENASPHIPMLFRLLLTFCTISPRRINNYSNDFKRNENITSKQASAN